MSRVSLGERVYQQLNCVKLYAPLNYSRKTKTTRNGFSCTRAALRTLVIHPGFLVGQGYKFCRLRCRSIYMIGPGLARISRFPQLVEIEER